MAVLRWLVLGAYAGTACAVLAVLALVWRRRAGVPGAGWLCLLAAGVGWWALVDLLSVAAPTVAASAEFQQLNYPAGAGMLVAVYALIMQSLDRSWRPSRVLVPVMAAETALVTAVVATNRWHGLAYWDPRRDANEFLATVTPGPVIVAHYVLGYTFLGALVILTLMSSRARALAAEQRIPTTTVFAVVTVFAWMANAGYVTHWIVGFDPTPFFALAALLFAQWTIFRSKDFVDLSPIASRVVVDHLAEPILVFDVAGRLVETNRAADDLFGRSREFGRPPTAGTGYDALLGAAEVTDTGDIELRLTVGGTAMVLDVQSTDLADSRGRPLGWAVVCHDMTRVHQQLRTIRRLQDELAADATHDPLTGLCNRRRLRTVMDDAVAHARARHEPLSMLMIDIDHFKAINDTYGHHVGDRALVALADILRRSTREADELTRFGGEEFTVLMPGVTAEQAAERAEGVRSRCERSSVARGLTGEIRLTVSIGVACLSPGVESPRELLEAADQALYQAKRAGRNRVVGAVPEPPTGRQARASVA